VLEAQSELLRRGVSPENVRVELIDGCLYYAMPGNVAHGVAISAILSLLVHRLGRLGSGHWVFLTSTGWHETERNPQKDNRRDFREPDVLGYKRERWLEGEQASVEYGGFVVTVPDFVCEVASEWSLRPTRNDGPSVETARRQSARRLGVRYYWLLRPPALGCRLEAYELHAGLYKQMESFPCDHAFRVPPFEEHELLPKIRDIWRPVV